MVYMIFISEHKLSQKRVFLVDLLYHLMQHTSAGTFRLLFCPIFIFFQRMFSYLFEKRVHTKRSRGVITNSTCIYNFNWDQYGIISG